MMIHQETDFKLREHDDDLHESIGLSHLHLNGFASAIKPHHNISFHPPCTSCGGSTSSSIPSIYPTTDTITITNNPMKRSSVDSSTINEPKSKRHSSLHDTDSSLFGYSKSFFPCTTTPPLPSEIETETVRSCVSDPYSSPNQDLSDPSSGSGNLFQSPPEKAQFGSGNQDATPLSSSAVKGRESFSRPPFPPLLTRSVSETISTPAKTFSRSSSSTERLSREFIREESPDSKRLKRIKDCMKQMSQWVDAIMLEDMEDGRSEVSNGVPKKQLHEDYESDSEEAVSVERVGENLKVHFKCPCNRGYQILISGGSCYYKLL